MSSQSDECRFCRLALGEPRSSGTGDEAFLLSRQILAIASVGALVRGWTLVIPTEHAMSLAVLSSERRIELLQSVEGLRTSISAELGVGTVVFEHGASSECSPVSCTTAHAHVHVVPFDGDLLAYAARHLPLQGSWHLLANPDDLEAMQGRDYLFASSRPFEYSVLELQEPVSQYFRRVIADKVGSPEEWNWREWPQLRQKNATSSLLARWLAPYVVDANAARR